MLILSIENDFSKNQTCFNLFLRDNTTKTIPYDLKNDISTIYTLMLVSKILTPGLST